VAVGCELVRITAPTVKDAANLKNIHAALRTQGCMVPLVADIHFKPEAAMEAAKWVEKIRINPGNFADSKKFKIRDYSALEYEAELERLREKFSPLVQLCKGQGVAMRIGTNHGSLSDRIMNRFGDTPLGMVESALEFARIARELNYHNFVFSMKASSPKVMIAAYRLLVARLAQEGEDWNYPIHIGVTEAGDGEDGRIKSAIGIGSLLADGIGDTIRVSLTEDSKYEIPIAQALVECLKIERKEEREEVLTRIFHTNLLRRTGSQMDAALDSHFDLGSMYTYSPASKCSPALPHQPSRPPRHDQYEISGLSWNLVAPGWSFFSSDRRDSQKIMINNTEVGGTSLVRVVIPRHSHEAVAPKLAFMGEYQPEFILEDLSLIEMDPRSEEEIALLSHEKAPRLITVRDGIEMSPIAAFRLLAARIPSSYPILLKDTLKPESQITESELHRREVTKNLLTASTVIGALLCDGIGDAVLIRGESSPEASLRLAYNILQSAGVRIFKTDYVACPSCGRTLFNLQETTARIKAATDHLKGVRIAIMGCIVNGPGEMADADFGYVGGAPGKVNLYVGKQAVKFNIPQEEAVEQLVTLIQEHGKWVERD
jgi:(E)-4-hydroxy-3-methylbut-2-enyl-diphosphate synthase